MGYIKMKRVTAVLMLLTLVGVAGFASSDSFPSPEEIDNATTTGNLLTNELFAALLKEFDETTSEMPCQLQEPAWRRAMGRCACDAGANRKGQGPMIRLS